MADYPLTCTLSAIEKQQPDFAAATIADLPLSLPFLTDDEWFKTSVSMSELPLVTLADSKHLNHYAVTDNAADDLVDPSITRQDNPDEINEIALDPKQNLQDSNNANDGIWLGEIWDDNQLDNGDFELSKLPGEELNPVQEATAEPAVSPQRSETLADPNDSRRLSDEENRSPPDDGHISSPVVDPPAVDLTRDDSEEPPRKRRRNRKKLIVPAEICYADLIEAAPAPGHLPFPRPHHRTGPSQPTTTSAFYRPCGPSPMPMVPQICGQTTNGYFIFVPTSGTSHMPQMAPSPTPWMDWDNLFSHPAPTHTSVNGHKHHQHPQQQSRNDPVYPSPAESAAATPVIAKSQPRPRPAVAPAQQQQFTFAPTTMPANFVANPNNHGRWSIDESGKRHYLNGARSKRPREGCS